MPISGERQTCALRALNLCDGQTLEHPDHALTECLCSALAFASMRLSPATQLALSAERQELIERTMLAPPLF